MTFVIIFDTFSTPYNVYIYSGKLSRENIFANFALLCLSAKVFSAIVLRLGGQ